MIVLTEEKCGNGKEGFLIGVVTDGGGRGGMYSFPLWPLFSRAGLAMSAPIAAQCDFSNNTLTEYLNAPCGTPTDSLANVLCMENMIPQLLRAVAKLTCF